MPEPDQADRFEVYVFVSDGVGDDDHHRYTAEHWFADQPAIETLAALLDGANRTFSILYPGVDADNFDVEVRRLRPRDVRPELEAAKPAQG